MPFFQQKKKFARQGLPNLGFTCYANSALQLLFQTDVIKNVGQSKLLKELQTLKRCYDEDQPLKPNAFLSQLY